MKRAPRFDAFERVGAPLAVTDGAGRMLFANGRFLSLTGRTTEATLGRRFWDLAATRAQHLAIERALASLDAMTRETSFESECATGHGTRHFLAWSAVAAIGEDSKVSHVVVTGSDVTEHKRAEHALEIARAEAEGIVSISSDAVICIDEQQRITRFNGGAEQAFGYASHEVLGQRVELLMPERFRGAHERQVRDFVEGPVAARRMGERRAVPALRKNGEEFPTDAAISKIRVGGRLVMTAVMRDITQRERLERDQRFLIEAGKLLAASLDYEKVLTQAAELAVGTLADCCIVDLLGDDGRIHRLRVAVSDPSKGAMAAQLRHRPRRPGAQPPLALDAFQKDRPLRRDVGPEFIEGIAEDAEHLALLKQLAPRSYIAVPLVAAERRLGAMVLISSTRHYTDDDLKLASDLGVRAALAIENARLHTAAQQATRARDAMLGVVAHDLRNPLNAIGMSTQLLGRKLRAAGLAEEQKSIETILHAAARANRLIADLLDVTRSEAGTLAIELQVVNPAVLLAAAADALQPVAAAHRFEVEHSDALPDVRADRDRVVQVFSNLVGNAMKFTPAGGRIRIGAAVGAGEVVFHVADTGPGIPPENQAHLFDRFWQASRTDKRGVGLGLPISKGIVEAHGGRIWVKSAPGEGSTFFFSVPLAP